MISSPFDGMRNENTNKSDGVKETLSWITIRSPSALSCCPFSGVGMFYKNGFAVIIAIAPLFKIIYFDGHSNELDSFKKMSLIFTPGMDLILFTAVQPLMRQKMEAEIKPDRYSPNPQI
jgi:hypothetical protein